jgi:uncharacterized membrane protein YukC
VESGTQNELVEDQDYLFRLHKDTNDDNHVWEVAFPRRKGSIAQMKRKRRKGLFSFHIKATFQHSNTNDLR